MQVTAIPVSDEAKTIFDGPMEKDDQVDIEMAKDGEVLIVSKNKQFSVWTPFEGPDWKVVLPSFY